MQHATEIARIIETTGMGELAAINRYLAEKKIGEDMRRGHVLRSTNWLK